MSEIEDAYDLPYPAHASTDAVAASGVRRVPLTASVVGPRANPDDPIVHAPPSGRHGPLPGPRELGAPGRVAIVQAQIFIVGLILIAQLWLVTTALFDLLSGHGSVLWLLTLISGIGFVIVLVVTFWPLRRVRGL